MTPLITAPDYPDIRRLIDPELTASDLPDATIESQFYLPVAEAEVAQLLPDNTSVHAKNAVAFLAAAYLLPLFPLPQRTQLEDFSFTLPVTTIDAAIASLRARAAAEIAAERTADSLTATRPRAFYVARQSRYG